MTFSFLLFITRKPTITPSGFKEHWDNVHVKLLKTITKEHFPITHTRHLIARPAQENGIWPAAILIGTQEDFTFDGIAELVFEDEAAFKTFYALVSEPEAAAKIAADEETFIIREQMRAVLKSATGVTSCN